MKDMDTENINQVATETLRRLLDTLGTTSPKRDNKSEWNTIRKMSKRLHPFLEQKEIEKVLNGIFLTLGSISPLKSNKHEWNDIRQVCAVQLSPNHSTLSKLHALFFQPRIIPFLCHLTAPEAKKSRGASSRVEQTDSISIFTQLLINFSHSATYAFKSPIHK